jgi:integrase
LATRPADNLFAVVGPVTVADCDLAARVGVSRDLGAALVLQQRREVQAADRDLLGPEWPDNDLVFTTQLGTPIHPRNDYRSFQTLISKASLRRVRLHDLRHTAASLMLAQGVAPRVVMEILGHSQISVTMNTYTHVDPELNRAATDLLQEALWPAQ